MPDDQSLEGNGISEAFFNLLWSKDELNFGPIVNIPDTVVFKDGLPISWYFTSLDGRIKRKKREKLDSRAIEESFTTRALGYDILATFISFPVEGDSLHRLSTIEYLDKQTLYDFLHGQNEGKSGILQRFIEPKGTKNDIIRAIWSPKICLLHRTENIYHLHDHRYGLYERCVTDEGPECFSTSSSLRGAALTDQIHRVCDTAVNHISSVTYGRKQVSRLVMNLKVDSRDKLWLLNTTSINCHCDVLGSNEETIGRMTKKPFSEKKVLLNLGNVFSLPDVVNLNPVKSYRDISTRKSKHRVRCVSCNEETLDHSRHPVSYKSIVKHYEHVIYLLQDNQAQTSKNNLASTVSVSILRRPYQIRWPPDPEIITAAGGVGFGCIDLINENNNSSSNIPKVSSTDTHDVIADLSIPPILRCIHPQLDSKSYELCRRDPIFLFKTVQVCESCFLVYAEFTTILLRMGQNLTSFLKSDLSIRKVDDRSTTMSRPSSADWRAMSVHRQSSELVNRSPPGRSSVVFTPSDNHVIAKNLAIGLRSSDTRRVPGIPMMIRGGNTKVQVRAHSSGGSLRERSSGYNPPVTFINQYESKEYSACDKILPLSSRQSSIKFNLIEFGKYQADVGESPYVCNQSHNSPSTKNGCPEMPESNVNEGKHLIPTRNGVTAGSKS